MAAMLRLLNLNSSKTLKVAVTDNFSAKPIKLTENVIWKPLSEATWKRYRKPLSEAIYKSIKSSTVQEKAIAATVISADKKKRQKSRI